jgi:hypothetical protein
VTYKLQKNVVVKNEDECFDGILIKKFKIISKTKDEKKKIEGE